MRLDKIRTFFISSLAVIAFASAAIATAPVLGTNEGGTGNSAGFVPGNIPVADSGGRLIDSGVQPALNYATNRAPTSTDCLGFTPGSRWTQTPAGPSFDMYDNTNSPTSCVWGQSTPAASHSYETKSWGIGAVPVGATYYNGPNGTFTTTNYGGIIGRSGTISNLHVFVTTQAGTGTYTFTLYVGTLAGSVSATTLTCQMTGTGGAALTCNDVNSVHAVVVTEGQEFSLQIANAGGAPAIALGMAAFTVTY